MSYYVVKPPHRSRVAGATVIAVVVLLCAAALLAGWAATQPVDVVVDGTKKFVPRGTRLAELHEAGVLSASAGRLIGVDGSIVDEDGGDPPAVVCNGEPTSFAKQLFPGDEIVSSPGADRRESLLVTDVATPFKTRYVGSGPLTELRTLGSPGLRRVTRGAVSGIEVTSTVLREPSDMVVARMRPRGKVVALTFDDGPWPKQTDRILRVLDAADVKATFFMLGLQVERHPDIAMRVARAGHGIGSHTHSHKELSRLSAGGVRSEIRKGRAVVAEATGHNSRLLRPPYGAMSGPAWEQARRLNARVVLWDVDSRDWTKPGARRIENNVIANVKPGSVVLFHDGGGDRRQTAQALPRIIRRLKARGYTFVTIDELEQLRAEAAKKRKTSGKKKARGAAPG